jgi:hypothetical protein
MTTETKPAAIILQQLGGANRLRAMINARNFMTTRDGQTLIFTFSMLPKANTISITLNALDLYDIEFLKITKLGANRKTVAEFGNVYAEDMRGLIEDFTGLALSL